MVVDVDGMAVDLWLGVLGHRLVYVGRRKKFVSATPPMEPILEYPKLSLVKINLEFTFFLALGQIWPGIASCCSSLIAVQAV